MNKKQIIEFTLIAVFLLSAICHLFKVPCSTIVLTLSGGLLAFLYFYLAAWFYAGYTISRANRIIAGGAFSVAIIALLFGLMHWQFWHIFAAFGAALNVAVITISLFNRKNADYKQLLYRAVFFLAVLAGGYACL